MITMKLTGVEAYFSEKTKVATIVMGTASVVGTVAMIANVRKMEPNEETIDYVLRLQPDWSVNSNPASFIPWDIDPNVLDRVLDGLFNYQLDFLCDYPKPPPKESIDWKREGF